VLASVAGIAASVAVVAASYDASVLQPQRIATAAPVTVPIVARNAPPRAADPFVVASVALVPAAAAAPVVAAASPVVVVDPILTYPAPGNPLAQGVTAPQPIEPPHPRLRPATPPAPKATLAAAPTTRVERVPYWLGIDASPDSSDPSGPTKAEHSHEMPGPGRENSGVNGARADLANTLDQGNGSGPAESLFRSASQVLSAVPQGAEPNVVVVALAPMGPPRSTGSAVPVPPAPLPAVIAGAPAVAATTGQLLFPLPSSAIIVPATVGMPVTATAVRLPAGDAHVLVPPARPHLRTLLAADDVLIFATPS
jgi:hypothetical protein